MTCISMVKYIQQQSMSSHTIYKLHDFPWLNIANDNLDMSSNTIYYTTFHGPKYSQQQ